jgi:hypothetical protein
VAGLGIAAVTAYRKRFLSAARITAYSLIPIGLVMTGVVGWLSHTALSPTAWAGFGVLFTAWGLWMSTRAVEHRRVGPRTERKETRDTQHGAVTRASPASSASSTPALDPSKRSGRSAGSTGSTGSADDFSDIEAILKKHGI